MTSPGATEWTAALALFVLLNMGAGLGRIWRGPTQADRMLAAQLFGSTGVAILVLLADALQLAPLRDVALVLALLAAMTIVVFVQRIIGPHETAESSQKPQRGQQSAADGDAA
jgi:multicomponent Na+:H+ antiporter subunit F